jgi:hypothetical protein
LSALITKAGGGRQEAVGRRQEGVFVTGIYTPLQKLFAAKPRGFRPDFFDNRETKIKRFIVENYG